MPSAARMADMFLLAFSMKRPWKPPPVDWLDASSDDDGDGGRCWGEDADPLANDGNESEDFSLCSLPDSEGEATSGSGPLAVPFPPFDWCNKMRPPCIDEGRAEAAAPSLELSACAASS